MWDTRDLSQPLLLKRLDDLTGVPLLHFDEDSKVLFVTNKGESGVSFYQYNAQSPNYIDFIHAFKGRDPHKGFSFLPKRKVDLAGFEILRGVRLTQKTVEYVTFKVPKKSGVFQPELYPPCKSNVPAMTSEEYLAGQDKEPNRF